MPDALSCNKSTPTSDASSTCMTSEGGKSINAESPEPYQKARGWDKSCSHSPVKQMLSNGHLDRLQDPPLSIIREEPEGRRYYVWLPFDEKRFAGPRPKDIQYELYEGQVLLQRRPDGDSLGLVVRESLEEGLVIAPPLYQIQSKSRKQGRSKPCGSAKLDSQFSGLDLSPGPRKAPALRTPTPKQPKSPGGVFRPPSLALTSLNTPGSPTLVAESYSAPAAAQVYGQRRTFYEVPQPRTSQQNTHPLFRTESPSAHEWTVSPKMESSVSSKLDGVSQQDEFKRSESTCHGTESSYARRASTSILGGYPGTNASIVEPICKAPQRYSYSYNSARSQKGGEPSLAVTAPISQSKGVSYPPRHDSLTTKPSGQMVYGSLPKAQSYIGQTPIPVKPFQHGVAHQLAAIKTCSSPPISPSLGHEKTPSTFLYSPTPSPSVSCSSLSFRPSPVSEDSGLPQEVLATVGTPSTGISNPFGSPDMSNEKPDQSRILSPFSQSSYQTAPSTNENVPTPVKTRRDYNTHRPTTSSVSKSPFFQSQGYLRSQTSKYSFAQTLNEQQFQINSHYFASTSLLNGNAFDSTDDEGTFCCKERRHDDGGSSFYSENFDTEQSEKFNQKDTIAPLPAGSSRRASTSQLDTEKEGVDKNIYYTAPQRFSASVSIQHNLEAHIKLASILGTDTFTSPTKSRLATIKPQPIMGDGSGKHDRSVVRAVKKRGGKIRKDSVTSVREFKNKLTGGFKSKPSDFLESDDDRY